MSNRVERPPSLAAAEQAVSQVRAPVWLEPLPDDVRASGMTSTSEHLAAILDVGRGGDAGPTRLRRWGLIFGAWTLYGLITYQQSVLAANLAGRVVDRGALLLLSMGGMWVWALLTPSIIWLARHQRFDRRHWPVSAAVHVPIALALAVLDVAANRLLVEISGLPPRSFAQTLLYRIDYSLFAYFLIVAFTHAADYYTLYRERRVKTAQLETQLTRAQLHLMKMQLQPHFLFNTLNAISELVYEAPEAADRMITRLGDLLRLSLDNSGAQEVTLKQELEFLGAYIEIERTRFQDRLVVSTEIEPVTLDACVPNLLLQPLVENAIRHGTGPSLGSGHIRIHAAQSNGRLELEIRDDGQGLPTGPGAFREGVGLRNTRARLQQLYGTSHRFELRNGVDGGAVVSIAIPFKTLTEDSSRAGDPRRQNP